MDFHGVILLISRILLLRFNKEMEASSAYDKSYQAFTVSLNQGLSILVLLGIIKSNKGLENMKKIIALLALAVLVTACRAQPVVIRPGDGMGMQGNGMMARHHAQIPEDYAGLTNPVEADEASLERGATLYISNCASCHGDGGMGDGPAGSALNPAPSAIAHTSQMMADDYLFWRISEGGVPFSTTMPAWKALDEQARWDVINYMRALGAGLVKPSGGMGGAAFDPAVQAAHQELMLTQAVEQGVITQAEADTFKLVHDAAEKYRIEHPEIANSGRDATEREAAIIEALVAANIITQVQADAFPEIHDRLGAAGLMP
jgi:mono/diheme cytochrome c family protein